MSMFRIAPSGFEKLSLLADSTRFEPAGSEPVAESGASRSMQPAKGAPIQLYEGAAYQAQDRSVQPERAPRTTLPCISEVQTPFGKKPLLKAMVTTACERNCFYCPFRAGRSKMERVTFKPDELAQTFDTLQRASIADGLFLSSGIIKGGATTQDKIIDTAEIIRKKYRYRGYIHLKIMPGAEYDQIRRAMQLANRVSINLEGATPQRLALLAPKKDYWNELITGLQMISKLQREEGLRASAVTQFVVGAVGDTDLELLQVSETLYQQMGLKRAYYSSFHPVEQTPLENVAPSSLKREFRLYQASFLLRDYGWSIEEMPFEEVGNLPLNIDPKMAWARAFLQEPVEVNKATRQELMRVPGIGPKSAESIVQQRRKGTFTEISHLKHAGVRDFEKSAPYILLNGKMPAQQMELFP